MNPETNPSSSPANVHADGESADPPRTIPLDGTAQSTAEASAAQPQLLKASSAVRLLAVGDAAIKVMELLVQRGVPADCCVACNASGASLESSSAGERLALDPEVAQGLGMRSDPECGATAAEAQATRITEVCRGARVVIIVAGLGGGTGTGAAPVIARLARASGAMVIAYGIMPFLCEMNLRGKIAEAGLQDLRENADLVVPFANERSVALASEGTTVAETYQTANEMLATALRAAYHAFEAGTVMGVPFADVCRLLRDRAGTCTMVAAESAGQDRVAEISDRLLNHPCLGDSPMLADADVVAVYVLGGASLAMLEVNRIVDRIGRECGSAPFIMGAAIAPVLQTTIIVALLTGRTEDRQPLPQPDPAPHSCRQQGSIGDISQTGPTRRPASRLLPPPPEVSPQRASELRDMQSGRKPRKNSPRMRQAQLPLDILSKGRFDKAEPTIHKGEDLDVPTYVRRGIALN